MAPLVQFQQVSKRYRLGEVDVLALDRVDLMLEAGEFTVFAGPSGSGKSTLLNLVGLLDEPNSGVIQLEGRDVSRMSSAALGQVRAQRIGFIFQSFNLIGDLTVYENVELPLTYRGTPGAERKSRVHAALERVGMAHRMNHYPSQLSGGMQQRVAIARALALRPRILITGSATVYAPIDRPITEEDAVRPTSPYGTSKLAQELLARKSVADGLDVRIARPFNHIGPRQDPSFSASGFARRIAEIEAGLAPPDIRVGNLSARRDLTDVRAMLRDGLVEMKTLGEMFTAVEPQLLRYPAIDPAAFRAAVQAFSQSR